MPLEGPVSRAPLGQAPGSTRGDSPQGRSVHLPQDDAGPWRIEEGVRSRRRASGLLGLDGSRRPPRRATDRRASRLHRRGQRERRASMRTKEVFACELQKGDQIIRGWLGVGEQVVTVALAEPEEIVTDVGKSEATGYTRILLEKSGVTGQFFLEDTTPVTLVVVPWWRKLLKMVGL